MKRYRLVKELPTFKVGDEFFISGNGSLVAGTPEKPKFVWAGDGDFIPVRSTKLVVYTKATLEKFPNILKEWFEEVKEFEEWRPKHGEGFKVMNIDGSVTDYYDWADSESDRFLLGTGNCYPLNTPDELIIKEQKLIPQAMHHLKMAAKKAWFEFNGSEGPDWSNRLQEKWKLSYDHSTDIFLSTVNRIEQFGNLPCFPTEESAQWVIDNLQDELKLVMGIKD